MDNIIDIIEHVLSATAGAVAFAHAVKVAQAVQMRLFWKKVKHNLHKIIR